VIPEFKDYCTKLVLKSRILLLLVILLLTALVVVSARPKSALAPGSKYLLFAIYKFNYTPEDYEKTFLKWELLSPLIDKEKLIKQVKENRLYSYFRPKTVKRVRDEEGVWVVCGRRVIFTDSPQFQKLKEGRFCVRIKNVEGKFFVEKKWWRGR